MRYNLKGYLISNYGRVYSLISSQFVTVQESEGSYSTVHLQFRDSDGIPRQILFLVVHRLVISSHRHVTILNGIVIDHLDMNRQKKNHIDNLEIVTPSENSRRAGVARREWREKLQKLGNKDEEPEQSQLDLKKGIWKPINNQTERDRTIVRLPKYYQPCFEHMKKKQN